ncbi:MAG: hypothetical protein AB7S99_17815 [Pseudodonghicola sp.]
MEQTLRFGAVAAFVAAFSYLAGFALLTALLVPQGYEADAARATAVVAAQPGLLRLWFLVIYVLSGLAVAVLAICLADLCWPAGAIPAGLIRGAGLIWATLVIGAGMVAGTGVEAVASLAATDPAAAVQLWQVLHLVETGLGGGQEIAGAIWALAIAWSVARSAALPAGLGAFAGALGVAGLLTLVPGLGDWPGVLFGLGFILWFLWAGGTLLRMAARVPRPIS